MKLINSGVAIEKSRLLVTILAIRAIHRWSHKQFQCVSQTRQLGSLEIREKKLEVGLIVPAVMSSCDVTGPTRWMAPACRVSVPLHLMRTLPSFVSRTDEPPWSYRVDCP